MIYFLDYKSIDLRHGDHWATVVPDVLVDAGYDVTVVTGTDGIPIAASTMGLMKYQHHQFMNMYDIAIRGKLKERDIIVYADAWNATAYQMRYILGMLRLPIKMIGVWRHSAVQNESKVWLDLRGKIKSWDRRMERGLLRAFDRNCYITPLARERFERRCAVNDPTRHVFTGQPLEWLIDERINRLNVPKEDVIVVPHEVFFEHYKDILMSIQSEFPEYEIISGATMQMSRRDYYDQLARAKAVLAFNWVESDPVYIYEGMMFDCVPIVPSRAIYDRMLPDDYKYPAGTIVKFLTWVRDHELVFSLIRKVMENYDDYVPQLQVDTEVVRDTYFNNQKFLKIIKDCYAKQQKELSWKERQSAKLRSNWYGRLT